MAVHTSGLAIAAMVVGVLWRVWIGSILAVVFGHISLARIQRSHGRLRGRAMAITGLVLGYLGLGLLIVGVAVAAAGGSS